MTQSKKSKHVQLYVLYMCLKSKYTTTVPLLHPPKEVTSQGIMACQTE